MTVNGPITPAKTAGRVLKNAQEQSAGGDGWWDELMVANLVVGSNGKCRASTVSVRKRALVQ
jgi:hypothetical protein